MAKDKTEQLRKITIGACGAQPDMDTLATLEKGKTKETQRIDVLDVFGIVSRFKPGQSDKGDYIRFIGQFKATNLRTKEVYTSGACIMPKMIEESLWGVLGEGVNNVQFGFRIGVKFDKDAATKYTYDAVSLLPVAENDPVALLERQVKLAIADKSK